MSKRKISIWLIWGVINVAIVAYLLVSLLGNDNSIYLIGKTTDGHHQIELACNACHVEAFGGKELIQEACVRCHGEELRAVDDSHPKSKFTDPRNADRVALLDARYCVTCHREHKPELTRAMGVTLPDDYCFRCHQDVAEDRPSHEGLAFNSCATAGCHNFHDNSALYEDFLVKHAGEPGTWQTFALPQRDFSVRWRKEKGGEVVALGRANADYPETIKVAPELIEEWASTGHSKSGVNCSDCHMRKQPRGATTAWVDKPGFKDCASCHEIEVDGFLAGKHGMRLAQKLSPMQVAMARLPMQDDAHAQKLGCASCHSDHRFDTRTAAVEACLGCHADDHSLAYKKSSHFRQWIAADKPGAGARPGVSCATCHLPREIHGKSDQKKVVVQHNQNGNLRPNEKMIRGVCMNCHGLGFSINALADKDLVRTNFQGRPGNTVHSIEWAVKRETEKAERKRSN
jgi:predicted CXXCH cytochrome family protein